MNKLFSVSIMIYLVCLTPQLLKSQSIKYKEEWSTYFGGQGFATYFGQADDDGNILITGYFPGWDTANQVYYNSFATQNNLEGYKNNFIAKFNSSGGRLWCFYFPYHITGITSRNNKWIICGITGGNPVNMGSPGVWLQNPNESGGYIAQLSAEGNIEWLTYTPFLPAALSCLEQGIYCGGLLPAINTPINSENGFQASPIINSDTSHTCIVKLDHEGQLEWGTYYGKALLTGLKADESGALYATFDDIFISPSYPENFYVTTGSFQSSIQNDNASAFVKFSADNGQRQWATFINGNLMGNIEIGGNRNIYISGITTTHYGIATAGAYSDTQHLDSENFIMCFNSLGERQWGTYTRSNAMYNLNFKYLATLNDQFIVYATEAFLYPAFYPSDSTYQATPYSEIDGIINIFNSQSGQSVWRSFWGGEKDEFVFSPERQSDTSFYIYGYTASRQHISTASSFQPVFSVIPDPNVSNYGATNGFLAKFVLDTSGRITPDTTHNPNNPDTTNNPGNPDTTHNPTDPPAVNPIPGLDSLDLVLFPNPNDGAFAIGGWPLTKAPYDLEFFDAAGRQLALFKLSSSPLQHFNFARAYPSGVYFARLINQQTKKQTTYKVLKK